MAELSKTKYKSGEKNLNKLQSISEVKNKKDEFLNLKIFDLVVLIFSFLSVVSDLCTG